MYLLEDRVEILEHKEEIILVIKKEF